MKHHKQCYICGDENWTEEHHVFQGTGRRAVSHKHGMVVYLCHKHHNEGKDSVHGSRIVRLKLQCIFQRQFEKTHTREEFIKVFSKSYIDEAELYREEIDQLQKYVGNLEESI